MHEGFECAFGTHCFEEGFAHRVEVNKSYFLLGGDFAYCVGVGAEGVGDFAVVVKGAAVHWSDEDGSCAFSAGLDDEVDEKFFVLIDGDGSGLHVIVSELHEEIVAGFHGGHDFCEALLSDKTFCGLAGFCMIGDDDAGEKETREHLAPGGPGFVVLVDDGGIAGEVDYRFVVEGFDVDGAYAGVFSVELEGEFMVPVKDAEFAGFQMDFIAGIAGDFGIANVGVKSFCDGGVCVGRDFFEHEAAAFGSDGGDRSLWATEDYSNAVVALGDGDREEEGLVAGAGSSFDGG